MQLLQLLTVPLSQLNPLREQKEIAEFLLLFFFFADFFFRWHDWLRWERGTAGSLGCPSLKLYFTYLTLSSLMSPTLLLFASVHFWLSLSILYKVLQHDQNVFQSPKWLLQSKLMYFNQWLGIFEQLTSSQENDFYLLSLCIFLSFLTFPRTILKALKTEPF